LLLVGVTVAVQLGLEIQIERFGNFVRHQGLQMPRFYVFETYANYRLDAT